MPGDAFKKVKRGERLEIPAEAYNAFIDATRLVKGGASDAASFAADHRSSGLCLVKNNTGLDLGRFSIVGIDGPLFNPADLDDDNIESFTNQSIYSGVVPSEASHCGKFVVLLEPAPQGQVAKGLACGLVACKVFVEADATGYLYADIADETTGHLYATAVGAAHILWREGGTGSQWALVRVSNPSGDIPICVTTTTSPPTSSTRPPDPTSTTSPPTTTLPPESTSTSTTGPPTTTTGPPTTAPPVCCPAGYTSIYVVTNVYCEDNDIVVCTREICIKDDHICGVEECG